MEGERVASSLSTATGTLPIYCSCDRDKKNSLILRIIPVTNMLAF
jgi:hypothetical protein